MERWISPLADDETDMYRQCGKDVLLQDLLLQRQIRNRLAKTPVLDL